MYKNISNVRITKLDNSIRIQAYRGNGNALHMGPEIRLGDNPKKSIIELINILTELYIE